MNRTFVTLLASLAGSLAASCPRTPDHPTGDAPPVAGTREARAAARGDVVSWGGGGAAKYAVCPRALCDGWQEKEGCPLRGCGGAPAAEYVPPPVGAEAGYASCDGYGSGYPGGGGGYYRSMPSVAPSYAYGPPPPAPPAESVTGLGAYAGYADADGIPDSYDSDDFEDADELLVFEAAEMELQQTARAPARTLGPTDGPAPSPEDSARGALQAKGADGEIVGEFPLQHTEVSAEISGYIARTVVEQQYANPFEEPIEAVYVFPLPSMAAVNGFVMQVGERKIVGIVRPRAEAEAIYAAARARGQTASLLTQERPNLFTQSVANIEPGGRVDIRITYFERLVYERGRYEWTFPMVVGPRYIPGAPAAPDADRSPAGTGGGTSPPTDRVPDADRITPPVLAPGERSGHDIGLTVKLDAGLPIRDLAAVTHCVEVEETGPTSGVVRLSPTDSIPNRDFVLRWGVDGVETQLGVLAHRGDAGGFFTIMVQPPLAPADAQVTPREITFLLDISGSMSGMPLAIATEIARRTLDEMRPDDLFNVFVFASGNGQLWDEPRPRTAANAEEARAYLRSLCGGGGTEMLAGVRRALRGEHDPRHVQMFLFFTDGYIGDEEEILRVVKEERGEARFFAFGIGSSVNRYLIDGIGEHGGGASHVVLPRDEDHAGRAVQTLFDMIDSPVLLDVEVDWNGLPVTDVYPARLPDLFAGQTLNLLARYTDSARGTAYLQARVGDRTVRLPIEVDLPEREPANEALAPIWARYRIDELSDRMLTAEASAKERLEREITDLAVEFQLVSRYTAFVAVDESRIVGDGRPLRILQPVEMPEGVSYEGVFGERPVGGAVEVPGWGVVLQATAGGSVRVGVVRESGAARTAGVAPGATITAIDGTAVHDLRHLEGLLLQGTGPVRIRFDPGGEITLPAP